MKSGECYKMKCDAKALSIDGLVGTETIILHTWFCRYQQQQNKEHGHL